MDHQLLLFDLNKKLWNAADRLRSNLDAAVYKHVVLGLIFLKYVSDAFDERHDELQTQLQNPEHDYFLGEPSDYKNKREYEKILNEELENRDYYTEKNVFWVPVKARWKALQDAAKLPVGTKLPWGDEFKGVGKLLDDALDAIEKENPKLKNILSKDFARLQLESSKLSSLIDLIATVPFKHNSLKAKDILGHVYEYFLGEFAQAEGKKGGQYFTPKSIVTLIVEMLEPYAGRVYDPAMGSGGFFISSEKFIEAHADKKHVEAAKRKISIYGQESNPTTWRLAAMNMVIRGLDFNFGKEPADSFSRDLHPDLRADFVMSNPPFNMKEWWDGKLENDARWKYGTPPKNNANFAWMQHMIHHLAPNGSMALLLANGSMSANTNNEGEIRKAIVEADLVECMVALPGQLFTNTQIPACIWLLTKSKAKRNGWRERKGEVLFIDARQCGYMIDRVQRAFDFDKDIRRIADTFHAWKTGKGYADVSGYCKSETVEEIRKHDYVLTPGRYVGATVEDDDGELFSEKMTKLAEQLKTHFDESAKLEAEIKRNLMELGYE